MALTKIGKEGIAGISNSANATAITIDSSERVLMPSQPSFRAESAAIGYATTSAIPFASVQHNVGSHFSTATNRFTAPISGTYMFHVHVGFVRLQNASNYAQLNLHRNGAIEVYSYHSLALAPTNYLYLGVNSLIQLSTNDYVHVDIGLSNASYYADARELQFYGYLVN